MQHAGAVSLLQPAKRHKCEDCGLKRPSFGLAAEGKKMRWCSGCSKAHAGAVSKSAQQQCEDCGLKRPTFGLKAEGKKRRWCSGCSKAHDGAVSLDKKRKHVAAGPDRRTK